MSSPPGSGPQPSSVTIRWLDGRTLAFVVLVSLVVSGVVGLLVALTVQSQANEALRAEQKGVARLARTNGVSGCDASNLLRGDARLLTHRLKPTYPDPNNLTDWLLRLRDCPATYDRGRIVLLPPAVEYRFLVALSQKRRVAVRDGGRRLVPMR